MTSFILSPQITLPQTAPTSTFAFLGTRGSGKTYGAGVLAEEFLSAGVQTVIVDPVGTWWALRLDHKGKKRGIEIPVFGGIHGDVELLHTAGDLVAQLIVERRISVVLDISDFTDGQQHRFVTDLCREIFRLKKRNKSPLHVIFEEGHEFFPQFVDSASAPMVGATKRMWKVGRNYGIGGTIVSQRAAEVNKGALNLTDEIFTGKLKAPEDIKRINGWANANGVSDDMIEALPDLPKGTLIAWRESGAVRTVFRTKKTFDASKTPDGSESKTAQELAPIDLDEVRSAMAAVVKEAQANDPKALRARIVELEREAKNRAVAVPVAVLTPVERDVVSAASLLRIERLVTKLTAAEERFVKNGVGAIETQRDRLSQAQQTVVSELGNLASVVRKAVQLKGVPVAIPVAPQPVRGLAPGRRAADRTATDQAESDDDTDSLPAVTQRMLGALRQGEAMGLSLMPFKSIAILAGVSPISGTTSNRKGTLVRGGYISVFGKDVQLTAKGRAYPIEIELPPRDRAGLLAYWKREIGTEKIAAMLEFVVTNGSATNEELREVAQMTNSGTFSNYRGELVRRGLMVKSGGGYVPAEVFQR